MQNRRPASLAFSFRAENGTRTRDPDLGKVVLYQLSYFRDYNFVFLFESGCKGTAFF